MAKSEELSNKRTKNLLVNLADKDVKKQLSAIKSLKVHGDETAIKPLVELLSESNNDEVKAEITDLLNTIKSTKVPKEIVACLVESRFKSIHQILLASIWNSGLDYTPYLKEIVQATINGDMMSAVECITIIENIEGEFSEDDIFEPLLLLREYLVANKEVNDPKMEILKEITLTLQLINDNL